MRFGVYSAAANPGPPRVPRWTCRSIKPGVRNLPEPLILSDPAGIGTLARNPAARMRDPEITTTESVMGGPPLPSMRTAPMIAFTLVSSLSLQPASTAMTQQERTTRILILLQFVHQRFQSPGPV